MAQQNDQLFIVKSAQQWMNESSARPQPGKLFGEFWFEDEICICFSDTNIGKSILAVQIAQSIASGNQIYQFQNESKEQAVVYFDFELSDKQFELRYSIDGSMHFPFSHNLLRAEINAETTVPKHFESFEHYLSWSMEKLISDTGAKVLIIDNITYLKNETEKSRNALPLMKELKHLKKKYQLSILILAHTPKRDPNKPLDRNDLQGSKMLINFCDSSFAIGESKKGTSTRYLKQIKVRNCEVRFDSKNVIECRLEKPHNFLQFIFISYNREHEHLFNEVEEMKENEDSELLVHVHAMSEQNMTQREISQKLGISLGKVNKLLLKK